MTLRGAGVRDGTTGSPVAINYVRVGRDVFPVEGELRIGDWTVFEGKCAMVSGVSREALFGWIPEHRPYVYEVTPDDLCWSYEA